MLTAAILVFATLFCLGAFVVGLVVGWMGNLYYHENLEQQAARQISHPEFYDAEGNVIENQVLTLRFEAGDDDFYDD
tara:strand:+ start:1410 stop:1640 length:231 start_codon:yes stop_codon:yes gene_type:complete